MEDQLEKLEKPKKTGWGGKREGSGRKPMLGKEELKRVKELIAQHGSEYDELKKKERCLALLDVLYQEGIGKRNIAAIKEYLDRQLGKPSQGIDMTSKGDKLPNPIYAGISVSGHTSDEKGISVEEAD